MIKLSDIQLRRLKETRISLSYSEDIAPWVDDGVISLPTRNNFAEDYASYFVRSEFYTVGAFSYSWSPLPEFVSLGRYCSLAAGIEIIPGSHPTDIFTTSSMIYDPLLSYRQKYYRDCGYDNFDTVQISHPTNDKDIIIGNDVYIGAGAKLRRGVKIGNGAIIGAYSVVAKDVAPYTVVAGSPARPVRRRYTEQQIACLEKLKWWDYDFRDILTKTHMNDIDLFIDRLQHLIDRGEIKYFSPRRNYLRDLL